MAKNVKICRICLSLIHKNMVIDLNNTKLEMLKIITPVQDILASTKSVLCNDCSESLQSLFGFKTSCLDNEDYLKTFPFQNGVKLILPDIVSKYTVIKNEIKQEIQQFPCRLCFKYCDSSASTDLRRIEDDFFLKDMFEKCLPEINLNITQDPMLCEECLQSLQNQFNFVLTLLDTNDKIKDCLSNTTTVDDNKNDINEINLQNVLNFTVNIEVKEKQSQIQVKEEEEIVDFKQSEFISVEELPCLREQFENDLLTSTISKAFKKEEIDIEENETLPKNNAKKYKVHKEVTTLGFERNPGGIYECKICKHETTTKASIVLHLQVHQDIPKYKCSKCSFVTKWRTSLTQHMWLHQDKEETKMYQCPSCEYQTRYKKHLKRHGKRHIKKTPYYCQYCKFETINEKFFKFHNKNEHGVEDCNKIKTLSCNLCEFTAHKKCLLTKHVHKVHKELVCEFCGFQTHRQWHLSNHMLKHKADDEVIMLQCADCDFQTRYKKSLVSHVKKHVSSKN